MKLSTRNLLSWLALGMGFVTIGAIMTGCSMQSQGERVLRVEIPRSKPSANASYANASYKDEFGVRMYGTEFVDGIWQFDSPIDINSFQCFGLSVSAADIPNDPREKCRTEPVGKMVGLISAQDGGILEIPVPAGAGRHIKLFAVQSAIVCPSLDDVMNGKLDVTDSSGESHPNGLGEAYVVADKFVDVFEDMTVDLYASYGPTNRKMFGCGDNESPGLLVPLTIAKAGYYPSPMSDGYVPAFPTAGNGPVSGEFIALADLTDADKKLLVRDSFDPAGGLFVPTTLNSYIHKVSSLGRAAVWFAWDASLYPPSQYPFLEIRAQIAGGQENDSCISGCTNYSHLFNYRANPTPVWGNYGGGGGTKVMDFQSDALSAKHVFEDGVGGKKYFVSEIESDFFPGGNSSQVIITGLEMRVRALPRMLKGYAPDQPGTGLTEVAGGSSVGLYGWGGAVPYKWKIYDNATSAFLFEANCQDSDACRNAKFVAPDVAPGETKVVRIVLSDTIESPRPQEYSFTLTVTPGVAPPVLSKLGFVTLPTNTATGVCHELIVQAKDAAGNPFVLPNNATPVSVDVNMSSSGMLYNMTDCGGTASQNLTVSIPVNGSNAPSIYFKAIGTAPLTIQLASAGTADHAPLTGRGDIEVVNFTKLLLPMVDMGGNGAFFDWSYSSHTINVSAVGDLTPNNATPVGSFGYAALSANNYGYLFLPDHTDWDLSGDFTVEMFARIGASPTNGSPVSLIGNFNGTNGWAMYIDWQAGLVFQDQSGVRLDEAIGSATIVTADYVGVWHHVAVSKSGGTCYLFRDGVLKGSSNCNGAVAPASGNLYLGSNQGMVGASFPIDSQMDEVRISKGMARWTTGFSPPVTAYNPD